MNAPLDRLKTKLAAIEDLKAAADVLSWDQETFMPDGGAEARTQQLATLEAIAHERFVSDGIGQLLDQAADAIDPPRDSQAAALIRVTRRDFERARAVPSELVTAFSKARSRGQKAWKKARSHDDFSRFAPHLERLVELSRQKAEAIGYDAEPYDALLEEYEPGMTTRQIATTFQTLRGRLVPIVDQLAARPSPQTDFLHQSFPIDRQRAFGEQVIADLGYDFDRGRQDTSAHPFTTAFSIGDVRLTTRFDDQHLVSALFSTLHEAGHGIYEQGIDPALDRTPLADGASLGLHESQSRLYENMIGRSRPFWEHYYPKLQTHFPDALDAVALDTFYAAINAVAPSLIRVEADEVTYNLHIMLRFELERGLIAGDISVGDLPAAWCRKMDTYLGVTPQTDAEGVLQDVHWSLGAFGYFPTYALGNLMAAQLYDQLRADLPNLDADLAQGEFDALLEWLRTHIHQHGRCIDAPDLLAQVTGEPLRATPWLRYVRTKYDLEEE